MAVFIAMAELTRPVGLRGELKAAPLADLVEEVLDSRFLWRRGPGDSVGPAGLEHWRWQGRALVLKLRGIDAVDAARAAVGQQVGFLEEDYDRDDFPKPAHPLPFVYLGLTVRTVAGETVGVVDDVLLLPANWVLSVRQPGGDEVLIPVIPPVLRTLDRRGGTLTIEPLPGLLDGGNPI